MRRPAEKGGSMETQLIQERRQRLEAEILSYRNKIQAIKLDRKAVPGTGLAEAKQIIEAWGTTTSCAGSRQIRGFAEEKRLLGCSGREPLFWRALAVAATVLVLGNNPCANVQDIQFLPL